MKQDIQKIYKTVLLVVFLVLLLFVSCESEPAAPPVTQVEKPLQEKQEEKEKTYDMDGGEAQLGITFSLPWDDGKALSSNHNNTYEYFLLTTEYLSERRDGSTVTGEYTDLKISAGDNGGRDNVDIGWFTQGKWKFSVKAKNADGDTLYFGGWEGYLSASGTNSITVSMEENAEDVGYLIFDAASMKVPLPRIVISYTKVFNGSGEQILLDTAGDGKGLVISSDDTGYSTYRTDRLTLPAGAYWLKVQLWSGDDLFSGEVLDTYIVPKKETTISGVFTITGFASYIRLAEDETTTFTDAVDRLEIPSGQMITGFHLLGSSDRIDFPYTNTTPYLQYLIPIEEPVTNLFSLSASGTLSSNGTPYPYRYAGFNFGYADSPKSIAGGLFGGTESSTRDIKAVYAPDVSSIGNNAFAYSNLEDALFGSLDHIGNEAFRKAPLHELEGTRFVNSVTIGNGAFRESGIAYLDIPSGATIGTDLFRDDKSLYRVSISTEKIPERTFYGCTKLEDAYLQNTTEIKTSAFEGCSKMKLVTLPESVKLIEARAFYGCSSMDKSLWVPAATKTIGENAFYGTTELDEIYLNAICGDIAGEPWGASQSIITWWAYKMFLNSNLPADYVKAEGEEEFPLITEQNGTTLAYPIDDPKYRLVAYNDVIGKTLDGYAIPIPVIDGYALRGWFTDPGGGTEVTQLTVNKTKQNWTVYAHWVRGLITVVFQGGRGGMNETGTSSETYRMVRYQGYYSRIGEEDEVDDYDRTLPVATIAGRDFLGWYMVQEPMLSDGYSPDETSQNAIYTESVAELKKVAAGKAADDSKIKLAIDATVDGVRLRTPVFTKKSHTLYAHYRDHRYTVQFNANLPTNAGTYGTRNGINVSSTYTVPASYTVVYNQPYSKAYDPSKLTSASYTGTSKPLPNLNDESYKLDNYWFVGWYLDPACTKAVDNNTRVAAQSKNGATITLYAKWIGKEKTVVYNAKYKVHPTDATYTNIVVQNVVQRFTAPLASTDAFRSYFGTKVTPGYETQLNRDQTFSMPTTSLTGYTFNGWYTGFDESTNRVTGTQVIDGHTFSGTATEVSVPGIQNLYAKFTANTYTVKFDPQGGTVSTTSKNVVYDSKYGELPVPTKNGYVFTGWYDTTIRADGYGYEDAAYTADTIVRTAQAHTLYAGWAAIRVIDGGATTWTQQSPLKTSVSYAPTTQNGYYGSGISNVASQTLAVKTILVPTRKGSADGSGKWSDSATLDTYATTLTFTEKKTPKNVITSSFGGSNGSGTITLTTTASAIPGTQLLEISTEANGDEDKASITVNLLGDIQGVTLKSYRNTDLSNETNEIYVRQTAVIKAVFSTNDNASGYVHASRTQIASWSYSAGSSYGETISPASQQCSLRFKYDTGTVKILGVSTPDAIGNAKSAEITINVTAPPDTIKWANGTTSASFTAMVRTIYSNNATARRQWMISGFGEWEGSTSVSPTTVGGENNSSGHTKWLYPYIVQDLTSAGTVTTIASNNANKYIAFPQNATTIGNGSAMFGAGGCNSLVIAAGSSGTAIGNNAFNDANIKDICLIDVNMNYNTAVTSCVLSSIGSYGMANNEDMAIPEAVFKKIRSTGERAFQASFTNLSGDARNNCKATMDSCTSLGYATFHLSGVVSCYVPSTCSSFGDSVFQQCPRLANAQINTQTVPFATFYSTTALTKVTLSNTRTIGGLAFYNTSITSITFPTSLSSLGDQAFESCSSLTTVTNFSSLSNANALSNLSSIPTKCFLSSGLSGPIYLPNAVSSIGDEAFKSTKISEVRFGSSLNSLGTKAFYGCGSLTTVDFLDVSADSYGKIGLGTDVFSGCIIEIAKLKQGWFSYTIASQGTTTYGSDGEWSWGYGTPYSVYVSYTAIGARRNCGCGGSVAPTVGWGTRW